MLQQNHQNGQQPRQNQQPFMPPSSPHNMSFDGVPHMNSLDASAAAKQMASLSAVGLARVAKVPPGPSAVHPQAPQSGSYIGNMGSNGMPSGHDNSGANLFNGMQSYTNMPSQNNASMQSQQQNNLANLQMAGNPAMGAQPSAATVKQRQRNFLNGLTTVMAARGTPLPPTLTGIPNPDFNPQNSPWKTLEVSNEVGAFRLGGKDVDLFKLWGLVFQAGGHDKLTRGNLWGNIVAQFDLPETTTLTQANGQQAMQPTARLLQYFYQGLLGNFEELYRKNAAEQTRKAKAMGQNMGSPMRPGDAASRVVSGNQQAGPSGSQPGSGGTGNMGMMGQQSNPQSTGSPTNGVPSFPMQGPPSPHPPGTPTMHGGSPAAEGGVGQFPAQGSSANILDHEQDGLGKRKLESEEADLKRARQKTGSEPPEGSAAPGDRSSVPPNGNFARASSSAPQIPPLSAPAQPKRQLSRRKIEYVPLERELETHGGRDLRVLEDDLSLRKSLRDVNEWGKVDIEAVTMSLRSRISTEISYALTTLSLISTMKGQVQGTGFPVAQCEDLMEELLDLLEDEAFDGVPDQANQLADTTHITTHREIMNLIHEEELEPFVCLKERRQGAKDRSQGPKPRTAHTIMTVMNILRNLTIFTDNSGFMANHERFLDLFLRVSSIVLLDGKPRPASSALSLSDLVVVRRDTLHALINVASMVHLSPTPIPSKSSIRMTRRAFDLIASYLVDPTDAVSPIAYVKAIGMPQNGPIKPPSLPEAALQVFTVLAHPDSNRRILSQTIPHPRLYALFESMVYRLPVGDLDFQLMSQETWLGYLEKVIMSIYAIGFLSPPSLKRKIKADRSLGFGKVMLRMVQKFLLTGGPQWRAVFMISAKRAVEAMKIIDEARDSFDTSQSTAPTLAFGMGWGDAGDSGPEKGTGLLGGHLDVTWDLLMQREVDEAMFSELESLSRVEC